MASYLNSLRHRLVFCFRERKPDGEGGWHFGPPLEVPLWGSVTPMAPPTVEPTSQSSLNAGHNPILFKGERYEVIVRALELRPHLEKPLAWIKWGTRNLLPINALHDVDGKRTYLSVQTVARQDGGKA
ncbi:MAG: hypothetical protein ACRCYP_06380 [Alphaproteobacteria bacterium]